MNICDDNIIVKFYPIFARIVVLWAVNWRVNLTILINSNNVKKVNKIKKYCNREKVNSKNNYTF